MQARPNHVHHYIGHNRDIQLLYKDRHGTATARRARPRRGAQFKLSRARAYIYMSLDPIYNNSTSSKFRVSRKFRKVEVVARVEVGRELENKTTARNWMTDVVLQSWKQISLLGGKNRPKNPKVRGSVTFRFRILQGCRRISSLLAMTAAVDFTSQMQMADLVSKLLEDDGDDTNDSANPVTDSDSRE